MSEALGLEPILDQARARGRKYDWFGAVEAYEKALGSVREADFLKTGQVQESVGYALYRAAMQAESQDEFRERMQRSVEAYGKAREFYGKPSGKQESARVFRCEAVVKYLGCWLTSDPAEKRKFLDECLELEEKALAAFSESGEMLEYVTTYSELSLVFYWRFYLEWSRETLRSIVDRGMQWGEKAVSVLSELGESHEIARVYLPLGVCMYLFDNFFIPEPEEIERVRSKIVDQLNKTIDLSEKIGDAYLLGLSHFWAGMNTGGDKAKEHFEKVLECGKLTRDNFLIAGGLDFLAYVAHWEAVATDDPEQARELIEKAIRLYDEGQHHYSILSFMSPRDGIIGPPAGHVESYFYLALWETDSQKRLELLGKSENAVTEALEVAEAFDMPYVRGYTFHVASKTLEAGALVEPDLTVKKSRLEKALEYREKAIEIQDHLAPFEYWNRGATQNYAAGIKAELADLEPDLYNKKRLLEEAVLSKERTLELCNKEILLHERMGENWPYASLWAFQDAYATLLLRLYDLTRKPEHLRKTIQISHEAIKSAEKTGGISRAALSEWRIAKAQANLEEHLVSAESFKRASEDFTKTAEKIPQLKDLYLDYAFYMQAWSEIEQARYHHTRQEYGSAKEHFEKAADIHKSLKQWAYLAPNYSAWAQIEHSEDLSRREKSEEALQAFERAAKLFSETKEFLHAQLSKIENSDEKQMATSILMATDVRLQYCAGRIALEEAKILDKQGEHQSSSEKYGSAAQTFERMTQELDSEQDKKEITFTSSLSRAWEKMTKAEAEASPELYLEASQLFEKAKEFSPNERAGILALGHSRFCRALEAGMKFADTREPTMHTVASRQLESAANYYVKASFPIASEYAKATGLLFDAYGQIDNAKEERDPEKKAKLYIMAEKVLQTSAGAYMKAEHPEKSEEVHRLLEKVREERELATSLTEVLYAPTIVSATTTFTTPIPSKEEAVGMERFEHADIQANIISPRRELKIGEDLNLEIELVNAGKYPALLIKITEAIPEGFDLKLNPENYRVEGTCINMKGKRLDPLKTEEVKLTLKPKVPGIFLEKPTVLYVDETGTNKAHELEPITITVKELGLKGWLKGEL